MFNQEACRCFFEYTYESWYPECDDGEVFNPLHVPYRSWDKCITLEEYEEIFEHSLGHDCQEGTSDDEGEEDEPTSNTSPALDRVSG